jgi:MFS transporter, FHS family, L-fucose permease
MAIRAMTAAPIATRSAAVAPQDYTRPLAVVTSLFFMWGFLTSLNDIFVPHVK